MPPIRKTKIREEITAKIQSRLQGATKKYADKILMPQRYLAKPPSINRTRVIRLSIIHRNEAATQSKRGAHDDKAK